MFQAVRGTQDLFGDDIRLHRRVTERGRLLARAYDFQEIETPIFEFSSVFHRLGESSDVVSKETYSFVDRGGDSITLRPEGTAGAVRAIISGGMTQDVPLRLFYSGPMFRYDRPQKGRRRQFTQVGAELIGVDSVYADIEVIAFADQYLKELDLQASIVLEINTLGSTEDRDQYRKALIDYFSAYKKDLSSDSLERLESNPLRILDSKDAGDQKIVVNAPVLMDFLCDESKLFFDNLCNGLSGLGISFKVNPRLVRGLDYYCHTAFEFTTDALGSQSTVLGGGRYDGLSEQLGGPNLPGVGWAAGVERLMSLMDCTPNNRRPFVIMPLSDDAWPLALRAASVMRTSHIACNFTYAGNLSKRLKKANKCNGIAAIIVGEEERDTDRVVVKNLDSGAQESVHLNKLVEYIQQTYIFKE